MQLLALLLIMVVCLLSTLSTLSYGQVETMIPLSQTGYSYERGNKASSVTVEFYIDLSCSSCLQSWPILREVYEEYKNNVRFHYKIFPLPYHQQAFILAKAVGVVSTFGSSNEAVFTYMDTVFAHQSEIYNSATADLTYNQVVSLVAGYATAGTGVTEAQYFQGMNSSDPIGSNIEMGARYMWKYACLQNVFATPFFAINGLQVAGLETLADWEKTLDALLA